MQSASVRRGHETRPPSLGVAGRRNLLPAFSSVLGQVYITLERRDRVFKPPRRILSDVGDCILLEQRQSHLDGLPVVQGNPSHPRPPVERAVPQPLAFEVEEDREAFAVTGALDEALARVV